MMFVLNNVLYPTLRDLNSFKLRTVSVLTYIIQSAWLCSLGLDIMPILCYQTEAEINGIFIIFVLLRLV